MSLQQNNQNFNTLPEDAIIKSNGIEPVLIHPTYGPFPLATKYDNPFKCYKFTVGIDIGGIAPSGADYDFDGSVVDHAEQNQLLCTLPAGSCLFAAFVKCTTAVLETATPRDVVFDIGVSAGAAEYMSAVSSYTLNEIARADDVTYVQAILAAATTIYIGADPVANWSVLTAGAWTVILVVLDLADILAIPEDIRAVVNAAV